MQILLTPRLPVPLAVVVPLLLALLVCQPGTGLRLLLAIAAPLLLLVCQPGTGLYMLLTIAVLLLLSGYGGHVVQIVSLAVSGRQLVPGGGIHNSRNVSRCNVLKDVHEELQGGELHRHQWLNGGSQGP